MNRHLHDTFFTLAALTMFALLVVFSGAATAAEASSTLSWEPPTTRVDGSPFTVAEIKEYRIYHKVDGEIDPEGAYTTANDFQKAALLTLDLPPRAANYVISFAISVVDKDGLESALSPTVTKEFDIDSTIEPSAPTMLKFTVSCGEGCVIQEITE